MSYTYGADHGPNSWAKYFPNAGGAKQSPININTATVKMNHVHHKLEIHMKHTEEQVIVRKEHNFQVSIKGHCSLTGGPVGSARYKLVQFHFHWGSGDTWGSEHLVNGMSHPCELHCVFFNEAYQNPEEVLSKPDGIVVVGVLFKLGSHENEGLKKLCSKLPEVNIGESVPLEDQMNIASLLPSDISKYYTYEGSLTTPPFAECVTWIVCAEPVKMTKQQLDVLRATHSDCPSCGSTDNFRPICPLGSRKVCASFNQSSF